MTGRIKAEPEKKRLYLGGNRRGRRKRTLGISLQRREHVP